jgi:3-phosphoshikimate 1-carboxyvinyltransferase
LTHRYLIAAALADGSSSVAHPLDSEDIRLTAAALRRMGADIDVSDDREWIVHGTSASPGPCSEPIHLGNSGTSMRLLVGTAALGQGVYVLTGSDRMQQRPIRHLLEALAHVGIPARSVPDNGCPPVEIRGGHRQGGATRIDCSVSSQYLSSLLLMAPCLENGLEIEVVGGPVSRPYVDLTVAVLESFGIRLFRNGYRCFTVPGRQRYRPGRYGVEPDCSQAGYFWAAAAVTGGSVTVTGISPHSRQGDLRFAKVLASMGCHVQYDAGGVTVAGRPLRAIRVDMADMPDLVPTLAVVAAFAEGRTRIENVPHLKAKESDRLAAVARELQRMGVEANDTGDGLTVTGGDTKGAEIRTYEDHRIAMSFAVAGLRVPGVRIRDETCVGKSFPRFWEVFDTLYRS